MPTATRLGFALALGLGAVSFVLSLSNPAALVACAIFVAAAAGLKRGLAWCGYGPALWLTVQAVLAIGFASANNWKTVAITAFIPLLLAWAFFKAGQAIKRDPSRKVVAIAWIGVVAANLLFVSLIQVFVIPTGAMEDTLLIGDHIVIPRFSKIQAERGGLVVFRYPVDPTQTFIKRVIGMPGDRIHIVDRLTFVNGVALNEPYKTRKTDYVDPYRDNFPGEAKVALDARGIEMLKNHQVNGDVVVPPGAYFVMGDNRDVSSDSRFWGFVPAASIIGAPSFIYWSEDQKNPSLFWWSRTRWDRTFKRVR